MLDWQIVIGVVSLGVTIVGTIISAKQLKKKPSRKTLHQAKIINNVRGKGNTILNKVDKDE